MIGKAPFSTALMQAPLFAACLAAGSLASPLAAQSTNEECARLSGTERVACLRRVLADTQAALERAERELGAEPGSAAVPATPRPASAPPASAPPQVAAPLGAEQVARRAGEREPAAEADRLLATIVSSERTYPNRLQVRLQDGQVWRQTQGDTQIVELGRNATLPAEIWSSGLGGYRMRLPSIGRVLRVERVR